MDKRTPTDTFRGLFAVMWSLMGTFGIISVMDDSGLQRPWGLFVLVMANLAVFYSVRGKTFNKTLLASKKLTLVGVITMLAGIVAYLVLITDLVGVWDAR